MHRKITRLTYKIIYFIFFGWIINNNAEILYNVRSTILLISSIDRIDWQCTFSNMLKNTVFFNHLEPSDTILINIIKNNTNSFFQTNRITKILNECVIKYVNEYNIVNVEQLNYVYRELKIYPEEHLNSYCFSMKIANYLHVDYLLYSIIRDYSDTFQIELQLISVQSGEIIHRIYNII